MAIGADQWRFVGLTVEPEAVFPFEFDAAYTYSATVAVDDVSFIIFDQYMQLI